MTIDTRLGLSPPQNAIAPVIARLDSSVNCRKVPALISALEYLKFARIEAPLAGSVTPTFSFAHRRFQEYFATCVLQRRPELVSAASLLSDARWRESAVVLCQTHSADELSALLDEARSSLLASKSAVFTMDPLQHVASDPNPFEWPDKLLHLLSLLQDGFAAKPESLPLDIRTLCADLLEAAYATDFRSDQRWALEVAGVLPAERLTALLRLAFGSPSEWLRDAAFRQTSKLQSLPDDLKAAVRRSLLNWCTSRRIAVDWYATKTQITRLESIELLNLARLCYWLRPIDITLCTMAYGIIILEVYQTINSAGAVAATSLYMIVCIGALFLCLYDATGAVHNKRDATLVPASMRLMLTIMLILFGLVVVALLGPSALKQWLLYTRASFSRGSAPLTKMAYLVAGYFILWAPLSYISAARSYGFVSPLFWPLMPLTGIITIFRVIPRAALTFLRGNLKKLVFITIASILVEVVGGIALFAIPKTVRDWVNELGWNPPQIIVFMTFLFATLFGGIYLFRARSDRRLLMKFVGKKQRMDEREFVKTLRRIKLPKYAAHFCRFAHDELSIDFSDNTGVNLLQELERTKPRPGLPKVASVLIRMGLYDSTSIPAIHPDVQDEIFKVIEARRRLVILTRPLSQAVVDDVGSLRPG